MKALENRIPPPVVLLVTLLLMKWLAGYDSIFLLSNALRTAAGIMLVLVGVGFSIAGIVSFKKAKTTVNPLKPDTASSLVVSGVYQITRNPMYLGMVFIVLGAAVYLSSILSLVLVIAFYLFISRFQIAPEERAMLKLFGDEFERFKKQVRRWI